MISPRVWTAALVAIALIAITLRLKGIHSPILDHPGWRQGDTAAIARNFATLQLNPLYPQVDYNGPAPNYVELELQIVPFLAALLYKMFGIHEVFGRLISLCFSVGTVVVIGCFARWLFADALAGLAAALLFAVLPGSVYYGRTFMPDTAMTFFATAALYASARFIVEKPASWRSALGAASLLTLALLAKPVALVVMVPIAALAFVRFGRSAFSIATLWPIVVLPLATLALYDRFEAAHAEWHWASGITRLHVLPQLAAALSDPTQFAAKWYAFTATLSPLAHTMLGPFGLALLVLGCALPLAPVARCLLFGWLLGMLAYDYAVVTVERVDYYLYLFVPLAALLGGAVIARVYRGWLQPQGARPWVIAAAAVLFFGVIAEQGRLEVAAYYEYAKPVYRNARALDATLARDALVVMGHYDPSVLYYINRKGWQEDPYLWTPFDEQSAIAKGARYFIAIESNRLRRNAELFNWLQRFPLLNREAKWPLYRTDPLAIVPGAEQRWREFRNAERARKPAPGGAGLRKP